MEIKKYGRERQKLISIFIFLRLRKRTVNVIENFNLNSKKNLHNFLWLRNSKDNIIIGSSLFHLNWYYCSMAELNYFSD